MNTNIGDESGVFPYTPGCFRSEGKSPTKLWEETNGEAKEIGFFSQCSTPRTGSQTTAGQLVGFYKHIIRICVKHGI